MSELGWWFTGILSFGLVVGYLIAKLEPYLRL